jgi:hypothetical protein
MTYFDKYIRYKTKYLRLKDSHYLSYSLSDINIGGARKKPAEVFNCVKLEEISIPEVFHRKLNEIQDSLSTDRDKFNQVTDFFSSASSKMIYDENFTHGIFTFKTKKGLYEVRAIPYITYVDDIYYFSWIQNIFNIPELEKSTKDLGLQYKRFIADNGLDYLNFDCFSFDNTATIVPITYDLELIIKYLTAAKGIFKISTNIDGHDVGARFMITDYVKL